MVVRELDLIIFQVRSSQRRRKNSVEANLVFGEREREIERETRCGEKVKDPTESKW